MKYYRVKATLKKWLGKDKADRWLTTAIVIALVIMFIAAMALKAEAHDMHFTELSIGHPIVAQGWITDIGYVWASDIDSDGLPDVFWLLYVDGDLAHRCLHAKPLTQETWDNAAKGMINPPISPSTVKETD